MVVSKFAAIVLRFLFEASEDEGSSIWPCSKVAEQKQMFRIPGLLKMTKRD